ncbi:hypothetical protein [Sphaerisporangium fuscum]|uniref:hypothetical protein n=1 Tax=Sphaerisporangium fuscum TaxID=2835868 RepID=UPI001BDD044F|nr:hypothetical protein [Sphaerisporangium fuscum]
MPSPRDHELLIAAKQIATALGHTAADVTELAVELGQNGRRHWPTADLLLTALAELAHRTPAEASPPDQETAPLS